jgi:hypothetical protein
MAGFDMSYGKTFGGGGFGGLGDIAMNALQGFQSSTNLEEALRKLQNQRILDQYRIPAMAAQYNNSYFQQAIGAYDGQRDYANRPGFNSKLLNAPEYQMSTTNAPTSRPLDAFMNPDGSAVAPDTTDGLNGLSMQDYLTIYGIPNRNYYPQY